METQSALPPEETERLSGEIVAALKTVFDPEIPADIYELGLIYKVDLKDDRAVESVDDADHAELSGGRRIAEMVENAVASVPGVGVVNVNLVWDPAGRRTGCRTRRASSSICGECFVRRLSGRSLNRLWD